MRLFLIALCLVSCKVRQASSSLDAHGAASEITDPLFAKCTGSSPINGSKTYQIFKQEGSGRIRMAVLPPKPFNAVAPDPIKIVIPKNSYDDRPEHNSFTFEEKDSNKLYRNIVIIFNVRPTDRHKSDLVIVTKKENGVTEGLKLSNLDCRKPD